MATFKICVFKHQKRKDNKYPVSIRIYWNTEKAYMKTDYYVSINQISQKKGSFELKDTFILNELNKRIEKFERAKLNLGDKIYQYSAKQLEKYFSDCLTKKDVEIDFIDLGREYLKKKKENGKSSNSVFTTINHLNIYFKGKLLINELTTKKLIEFEEYLRKKGCRDNSIHYYMASIRTLFNYAIMHYNEDDFDPIIKNDPFRKYKIPTIPYIPKRNISPESIMKIYFSETKQDRVQLAKDVFLLSFLLVGMNTTDLYHLTKESYKNGRITYNRKKTKDRRRDKALISIKVENEAVPLINKYTDINSDRLFNFHKRYSSSIVFSTNINIGLKEIASIAQLDVPLTTYYARHSWATIARNQCDIPKSDISECLNHATNTVTDDYISKDWHIIDKSNRKVLDYVFSCQNREKKSQKTT